VEAQFSGPVLRVVREGDACLVTQTFQCSVLAFRAASSPHRLASGSSSF
jgi:hypothetical protein